MSIRSSLIIGVVAATAALGVGSPAFAQAWSNGWGTGNSQPGYFDKDGGMHAGNAPQQLQAVTPGRGLYAFAGHNRGLTGFASIRHPHRGANKSGANG
ncbi:MAG: hypothetical protein WAK67_04690 [Xanthobacteraceae bacterium]|jgi:hypothetical protein